MNNTIAKKIRDLSLLKTKSRIFYNRKPYIKKYQEIAVGNDNLLSLLKYELIITTISWISGALGIILRKYFYSRLFKQKLKNVIFGKNVDIFNPDKIKIGRKCIIGDNCLLEAKLGGSISIGIM